MRLADPVMEPAAPATPPSGPRSRAHATTRQAELPAGLADPPSAEAPASEAPYAGDQVVAGRPELLSPYVGADFPTEEFRNRIEATRTNMWLRGLDGLLVVSPENIYYLLGLNYQGYFSFNLLVLPMEGAPLLVTRSMERMTVGTQVPGCVHVPFDEDEDPAVAAVHAIELATSVGDRVGVEESAMHLPIGVWQRMVDKLSDRAWVDGSGVVEEIRAVKSEAEIGFIRRAARISDRAAQEGIATAGTGVTERMVAAAVYHEMIYAGSEHPGFAPFIRSTDILRHEHVTWRDREIRPGSGLLMELSASVYRYHAPLTRMVYVGDQPRGTEQAAEIALGGLEAIRSALRPGALSGDVYAAWQKSIDAGLGHSNYRRHHCGYMVGIGFPPSWVGGSSVIGIRNGGNLTIRSGMVFHVLSWLFGEDPGDYAVSDTALVTPEGCEFLTTTSREPLVLP